MFVKAFVTSVRAVVHLPRAMSLTVYAILAVIVGAVALVALLSAVSADGEFDGAMRLSWWFA